MYIECVLCMQPAQRGASALVALDDDDGGIAGSIYIYVLFSSLFIE